MWRAWLIGILLVVVFGWLAASSHLGGIFGSWDTYSWNQKLTVTVETPEGERSASAVTHVSLKLLKPGSRTISAASAEERSAGEAVVVPLPEGQYLFALRAGDAGFLPQAAFAGTLMTEADHKGLDYVQRFYGRLVGKRGLSGPLPRGAYPRFVTFDDLSDPLSVKLVDPNDLAATFGPGTRLKSITLEITDEPVTQGKVTAVLGWLEAIGDGMLDGNRISTIKAENRLANDLSRFDFKRN